MLSLADHIARKREKERARSSLVIASAADEV
jgi:hypothetical protein